MLHETIRNGDFKGTQRFNIVSTGHNIVAAMDAQPCVALKIVVANHPV